MLTAGVDIGTTGVRAVLFDPAAQRTVGHVEVPVPPGTRTEDGGHVVDEAAVVDAALEVLTQVCAAAALSPVAVSVAGTAGTVCFRDSRNRVCAPAVMYDDARFGTEIERLAAWKREIPEATRVLPITDAVLEALGSRPGFTDWTNARKLGWDPGSTRWPPAAWGLREAGFLPRVEPPGAPAGTCRFAAARGALLTRGATDSCAMHIGVAAFDDGAWSVSLGTTVTWKAALRGAVPEAVDRLPAGAYAHRLAPEFWLAAAAGNSGGGALLELDPPDADLGELDRRATIPTGFAAYPLPRRGDRFPVADSAFAGFGVPPRDDPRLHAAMLEGVAFVVRLGVERIAAAGVARPDRLFLTGGGAASAVWARLVASVMGVPVAARPQSGPATGAAVLAAAAVEGVPRPRDELDEAVAAEPADVLPDPVLLWQLDERYAGFLDCLSRIEKRLPSATSAVNNKSFTNVVTSSRDDPTQSP
jgi:sugar (pentulose or hexulose) kinase